MRSKTPTRSLRHRSRASRRRPPSSRPRLCASLISSAMRAFRISRPSSRKGFGLRTPSYEERLTQIEKSGDAAPEAALCMVLWRGAHSSIMKMEEAIREEDFKRAIEVLGAADTIYLIAKRRSYALTAHLCYAFSKLGIRHQMVASPTASTWRPCSSRGPAMQRWRSPSRPMRLRAWNMLARCMRRAFRWSRSPILLFSPLASISTLWFEVAEADFAGFRSLSASLALTMALAVGIAEFRRHEQNAAE